MRTTLNPIMLALLAALAAPAMAAERGQIMINSSQSNLVLDEGDTVSSNGDGSAIHVTGTQSQLSGDNIIISATGNTSKGLYVDGGGKVVLTNSKISIDRSGDDETAAVQSHTGGSISLTGGTVTANSRHGLFALGTSGGISVENVDVKIAQRPEVTSSAQLAIGVYSVNSGLGITMTGGSVTTTGDYTYAVAAASGGKISLTDTVVNSGGAFAAVAAHNGGTLNMTRGSVTASKDGAVGVSVGGRDRLRPLTSTATLTDVGIILAGNKAIGLQAGGELDGGALTVTSSSVDASGANAVGMAVGNQSRVTLDDTRITVTGQGAIGVLGDSGPADSQGLTETTISNHSDIATADGAALVTLRGAQTFLVSDSTITGRAGGDIGKGVLLLASSRDGFKSEQVTLDATGSTLNGDVLVEEGTASVQLKSGSTLTGAVVQRGAGSVSDVAVDGSSTWNVRGDSRLGTLNNAGTVAFVAPGGGSGFKTLTVNNYVGGGTLVLNTRLGDDAAPTDKLVIDGGTASGSTSLRVINADGEGGRTRQGIRVVQAVNGGMTGADAFRLDAGSTGYRASADMLSLNGYDYALVRGGNGGEAQDWYLTSEDVLFSGRNVSPESGAYSGIQTAGMHLFSHSLQDRVPGYAGQDGAGREGGVWTRVQGRRDSGQGMSQGQVNITTDSAIVQLGADLIKADLGQSGAVYAGLMGGYGDARVRSTSTLMRPNGAAAHARTDGKLSGYSVGLYGTYYQNDATRLGAYADTWLQWSRYNNQVNSELGSARYRSTVISTSLEAGYAMTPFAPGSMLGAVVVQPHAQLTYSRYDAQDATLQGTRMRSGDNDALDSRLGVRVYPQATAGAPVVRPFLEANWLHRFSNPSVKMGSNVFDAKESRNRLELKLGAEGYIGRAVKVSGNVFGQASHSSGSSYGGMLNVGYHW